MLGLYLHTSCHSLPINSLYRETRLKQHQNQTATNTAFDGKCVFKGQSWQLRSVYPKFVNQINQVFRFETFSSGKYPCSRNKRLIFVNRHLLRLEKNTTIITNCRRTNSPWHQSMPIYIIDLNKDCNIGFQFTKTKWKVAKYLSAHWNTFPYHTVSNHCIILTVLFKFWPYYSN